MTAIEIVRLTNGDSVCEIAPRLGGSILRLFAGGGELLRRAPLGTDDIQQVACFLLVPFANRIAHGRFSFQGRDIAIGIDPKGKPHALHGHGWRRSWTVIERRDDRLSLAFDHDGEGWPWPYRAEQTITLRPDGIEINIVVHNRHSTDTMPVGVGLHPFFLRSADSSIAGDASAYWRNDETGLATTLHVDTCFQGDRPCSVENLVGTDNFFVSERNVIIGRRVRIAGDRMDGFHVYVPAECDFFCVEPVTHAPNSFGRGQTRPEDLVAAGSRKSWSFSIKATSSDRSAEARR